MASFDHSRVEGGIASITFLDEEQGHLYCMTVWSVLDKIDNFGDLGDCLYCK